MSDIFNDQYSFMTIEEITVYMIQRMNINNCFIKYWYQLEMGLKQIPVVFELGFWFIPLKNYRLKGI